MADKEDELKELKKLPPKERIKKLKELQEKNKKEIDEAKKLIEQSEDEQHLEEAMGKVPVPEVKKISIDDLFDKDEEIPPEIKEEEYKEYHSDSGAKEQQGVDYLSEAKQNIDNLRDRLYDVQRDIGSTDPSNEQRRELYDIGKQLYEEEKAVRYLNDQHAKGEIQKLREKQKDLYSSRQ